MDNHFYGLIMAGGVGSRFWPKSRSHYPKQFIDILGTGETLIQSTFRRLLNNCPAENIFVVTNQQYVDLVAEQLPELSPNQIIAEPARRNTAPCIAYACSKIHQLDPKAAVVVSPADHIITKEKQFETDLGTALTEASANDILITLGIVPNRPDTGYGYIQYNGETGNAGLRKVKTFTEKPDLELAKQFLDSGDFLWNSGIFIWKTASILEAFKTHEYDLFMSFEAVKTQLNTEKESQAIAKMYPECKNISIDYAVMEKASNVFVLPVDFGWSDLGTWGSLYEHSKTDDEGNAIQAKAALLYQAKNNIINMDSDRLVVLSGLNDYIVVEKDNVLLICPKSEEQKIKQFTTDAKLIKGGNYT